MGSTEEKRGCLMFDRSLFNRILEFAKANKHRLVWKKRLYALCYGASLKKINDIKE
jgi:hypothetical protein